MLEAARQREIDLVLVCQLDRWGRSVADLLVTLQELEHLGVGFVSLTEVLDLTTPAGRAMAGLLAIFAELKKEILRERTKAEAARLASHKNARHDETQPEPSFVKLLFWSEVGRFSSNCTRLISFSG